MLRRNFPFLILLFALGFFFLTERSDYFSGQAGANEPVTLSIWAWSTPADTLNELRGDFELQYPNVHLDIQTVPWLSLQQKTLWAVAANSNVPDIVIGSSEWTGALAASGGLEPLDDYFEPEFFDAYFPQTLGIYQFPEVLRDKPGERGALRQYGIPLDLDLMMVFYRADVLDPIMKRVGMKEFPADWAGFEKLGRAVAETSQPGEPSRHLLYLDPYDEVPLRMAFLPASGARTIDETFTQVAFASPEAQDAFMFFGHLLHTGAAIAWHRSTNEDPMMLYKQERAFLNIAGPYYAKHLQSRAPELSGKWRIAQFPRREPELVSSGLGGACMAIPYNAKHRRVAVDLIRFMASLKFARAYFDRVGSPPPQREAWDEATFNAPQAYFGGQRIYQVVREAIENAEPLQLMPTPEISKGPLRRAMHEVAMRALQSEPLRDAEVSAILRKAAADADNILKSQ